MNPRLRNCFRGESLYSILRPRAISGGGGLKRSQVDSRALWTSGKRVVSALELHDQWSPLQFERVAEEMFQIPLVRLGDGVQRRAMHHNDRRIHPALVRIAQLRAPEPVARRLLALDRLL